MFNEDITFCMNDKCDKMECFRNPKHVKLPIAHSFAWLDGTEHCPKTSQDVADINVGNKSCY